MTKYYVVSDTHSFFTQTINALKAKGFDENNPEHKLILCGDLFDRGLEAVKIYEFVKSLGSRFIYVRGNHEDLLEDCLCQMERSYRVSSHHVSNKTFDTICQFLFNIYGESYNDLKYQAYDKYWVSDYTDTSAIDEYFKPIREIIDWIYLKSIDYAEIGDYIFVHGWIPKKPIDGTFYYYNGIRENGGTFDPNWRENNNLWNEARWLNGMREWQLGFKEPNKTIVCGHWHCSWGHAYIEQKRKEFPQKNTKNWQKSFEPFYGDGIIAIDACTAYSNMVNVLVFEEISENCIKLLDTNE